MQFIRKLFNFGTEIKDNTLLAKVFNSFVEDISDEETTIDDIPYFGDYLLSGINFTDLEIPNRNALATNLSVSENASINSLIERGELQMRCV